MTRAQPPPLSKIQGGVTTLPLHTHTLAPLVRVDAHVPPPPPPHPGEIVYLDGGP